MRACDSRARRVSSCWYACLWIFASSKDKPRSACWRCASSEARSTTERFEIVIESMVAWTSAGRRGSAAGRSWRAREGPGPGGSIFFSEAGGGGGGGPGGARGGAGARARAGGKTRARGAAAGAVFFFFLRGGGVGAEPPGLHQKRWGGGSCAPN